MSDVIIMTFDDTDEAGSVRRALRRRERRGLLDLEGAAVVVREGSGETRVDNEVSSGMKAGTSGGAFAGLILGFMFPSAGAAVGAVGGARAARWLDRGVERAFVEEVSDSLRPGTSALLLVVTAAHPEAALAALRPYRGRVYHTTLDPEAEAAGAMAGRVDR